MSWFGDLFFPKSCPGCGELLDFRGFGKQKPEETPLCKSCHAKWESEKQERCGICGVPVSSCLCMTEELRRAGCLGFCKLSYYRHGTRDPVPNRLIFQIKDHRNRAAVRFLAKELVPTIRDMLKQQAIPPEETVLTYLPRGLSARFESGTDQAKSLCRALSEELKIPALRLIGRAPLRNKQQKRLSFSQRKKNAQKTFYARTDPRAEGKYVVLIDDIVTTGAGMAVCAKRLRKAGVHAVFCAAIASDDANREPVTAQPHFGIVR